MAPKRSDAGNSDTAKARYKVLHFSEKVRVLSLIRKENKIVEIAKTDSEKDFSI